MTVRISKSIQEALGCGLILPERKSFWFQLELKPQAVSPRWRVSETKHGFKSSRVSLLTMKSQTQVVLPDNCLSFFLVQVISVTFLQPVNGFWRALVAMPSWFTKKYSARLGLWQMNFNDFTRIGSGLMEWLVLCWVSGTCIVWSC